MPKAKKKKEKEPVIYPDKFIKALETLTDEKLEYYKNNYNKDFETFVFTSTIDRDPDQYVMARFKYNGHTWNPKSSVEADYKKNLLDKMPKEDYDKIQKIINGEKLYNVRFDMNFYIQTPKNLNIQQFVLAEKGIRRPVARRDCDNMAKLLQDSLAGVLYTDDCYVTSLHVEKYNSMNPRIEIKVTYSVFNELDKRKKNKDGE